MTITKQQKAAAELFQTMHKQEGLVVLPNIWDAGGARIFEEKGFKAIATTSAGIAFANGFSDGEVLPLSMLIETVKRITNRIRIPLSVDFERGYGEREEEIYENTKLLLFAGAIGLNIEDGLPDKKISEPHSMRSKLEAITYLKKELGFEFFINARTDLYWNQIGDEKSRLAAAIERGNNYLSWGADCLFVPGNIPLTDLEILTKEVDGPINILLSNHLNNLDILKKAGVKRVSLGSALSRNSINHLFIESEKIKKHQFHSLLTSTLSYADVNQFYGLREEEK